MNKKDRVVRIASLVVIFVGVTLLILNLVFGDRFNVALPLVFYVLSGGFFILIYRFRTEWTWASYLYIPAFLLASFALIFTLNVITRDWSSWAYAWILLIAASGIGILFAGRDRTWPSFVSYIGWGSTIAGITFFGVFGVIKGGQFIQIVAPLLLVAAGISLRWLKPGENTAKIDVTQIENPSGEGNFTAADESRLNFGLLSLRELEVLKLMDKGLTNQQIALRLSVAESTIKTHINNIYSKLGVQTRAQALARVRKSGVLKE